MPIQHDMASQQVDALRMEAGALRPVSDALTVEAVLQIRVNGAAYTTTVRTPGEDDALARGLLFSERVVVDPAAHFAFASIVDPETGYPGVIDALVAGEFIAKAIDDRRSIAATASCGLCGTRDAADIQLAGTPLRVAADESLDLALVAPMFAAMRAEQRDFARSGGCHGAAAFTLGGELLAAHEDIGRHNAVDKVIGRLLMAGRLGEARCLTVSGRLSYEIVFKTFHARIPFLLSVSAPSTLAVSMGQQFGMTVVGFCRDGRATVYSHAGRCRA